MADPTRQHTITKSNVMLSAPDKKKKGRLLEEGDNANHTQQTDPHKTQTTFYNKEDAKDTIESLILEQSVKDKMHLSRVMTNMQEDALEEMVFTMTGAIFAMDLPPITKEMRMLKEKMRFLSQSVRLVGLGSKSFDNTVSAIKAMQVMGEQEFREGKLEEWKLVAAKGFETVDLLNQYFRPRNSSNEDEGIPIAADVDPSGILGRIAQRKWIHTEDNVIRYYRGIVDEGGKKRYMEAKPQIFRVGDIVEVQCSMVFMKTNESMAKMKAILRALALINCDHSSKANADRKNAENMPAPAVMRMKRKIGFEEEEDEDVYARVKKANRMGNDEGDEGMTTDA
ncbi:hypothetical protein EV421DRAFT_1741773 [Armillaria borealis]|uniref:Uncharacterized protein n=1 Tax=Armillaria borealis TaxID=47425 RepID=A0AA39MGP0_9AGAR|nr:hypothetical protein EV421DRAFT_1741773 [Armillaria borealis]